jgi:2-(1,2-epoxy-1,2-dihydrophenyl)acetyl-CoA isomerase
MTGTILADRPAEAVLRLTLSNPAKRNAISAVMMDELAAQLRAAAGDPGVKAVVLTGAGDHFSAGGDLDQPGSERPEDKRAFLARYQEAIKAMRALPQPIVAAADGHVVGGAFSLVVASDLVVVSDRVKVTPAFCAIGIVPEMGLMKLLPELVGQQRAKEILWLNRRLLADDLERLGIANQVVPAADLAAAGVALAAALAGQPSLGVQLTKTILNAAADTGLDQVLAAELTASPLCSLTDEFAAVAARVAKK